MEVRFEWKKYDTLCECHVADINYNENRGLQFAFVKARRIALLGWRWYYSGRRATTRRHQQLD